MAQTVAYWQNKMLDQIAADPVLADLNSPSAVAIFRLFTFVVATCINLFEQAIDLFKTEVELIASEAVPGTAPWVQREALKFQYSATSPQVVQLVNFVPAYPIIDEDLQIITRCSVKTMANKVVSIKVAKLDPPEALTTPELNSFKSYLDVISFAGVQYNAISLDADRLFLAADIYYNGAYAGVISATVIAAIDAFLADIPFDGIVKASKLIDAIQSVPGVTDVAINDLAMRANGVAFSGKTYLIQGYDTLLVKYPTSAGYVIQEDTAGETFADKLNFVVEV